MCTASERAVRAEVGRLRLGRIGGITVFGRRARPSQCKNVFLYILYFENVLLSSAQARRRLTACKAEDNGCNKYKHTNVSTMISWWTGAQYMNLYVCNVCTSSSHVLTPVYHTYTFWNIFAHPPGLVKSHRRRSKVNKPEFAVVFACLRTYIPG